MDWKRLSYDGLDFIKGKHSAYMSCNKVCLSYFIHINLFYISIVWKYNNGHHFGKWNKIIYGQTITFGDGLHIATMLPLPQSQRN